MSEANGRQLATIPVPGADVPLQAVEIDGKPMVALKPLCDALGVDYSRQVKKLKGRSWATMGLKPTVADDGKVREMLMIDRRTLTMWLATIDENRVNEQARPTILAYQAEAADALDAYFSHGGVIQTAPVSQFDVLRAAIDQIETAQREAEQAKAIASKTEARLDAIEGRHDWYSALGYARLIGCVNTSTQFLSRVGRQAAAIAREHGIEPVKVQHQLYGTCNSLPVWVWELAFDGRADT